MPRYIDAEKIGLTDFEIVMCDGDYKEALKMVLDKIENAPTVDAVEVVRCKDCRFHEHEEWGMVWCPNVVGSWMAENGFCSMGERRKDETD